MTRVKVAFSISGEQGGTVENMYAQPVEGNRYVLDNSPFYAFDISFCDEFFADEISGGLVFSSIASRGGHSTYRIKIPVGKDHDYFLSYWDELAALGCSYEGSSANLRMLYSIDMAPSVDIHKAYSVLEKYEELKIWEFEEAHYCESVKSH